MLEKIKIMFCINLKPLWKLFYKFLPYIKLIAYSKAKLTNFLNTLALFFSQKFANEAN